MLGAMIAWLVWAERKWITYETYSIWFSVAMTPVGIGQFQSVVVTWALLVFVLDREN